MDQTTNTEKANESIAQKAGPAPIEIESTEQILKRIRLGMCDKDPVQTWIFPVAVNGTENKSTNTSPAVTTKIAQLLAVKLMPAELVPMFTKIQSLNQELVLDQYTIYALSRWKIHPMGRVDFAVRYLGMGHVSVISWWPDIGLYTARLDGGANEYEREASTKDAEKRPAKHCYMTFDRLWYIANAINPDWTAFA
jgi:hypothetical protein